MDSDEGYNYEFDDEEEECSEDSIEEETADDTLELGEVELVDPVVAGGERDDCGETGGLGPGQDEEDYRFEVLTAEQILQHMVECIREVNEVIQVSVFRGLPELRSTLITKEEILTSFRETLTPVDNSRDMKNASAVLWNKLIFCYVNYINIIWSWSQIWRRRFASTQPFPVLNTSSNDIRCLTSF